MPLTLYAQSDSPGLECLDLDGLTIFALSVVGEDPADYPKAFPATALVAQFVGQVLSQRGQAYSLQGAPILRHTGSAWLAPPNADALLVALSHRAIFALRTAPLNELALTNGEARTPYQQALAVRGLSPLFDCGRGLAQLLHNTLGTEAQQVTGLVRHPYAGQSAKPWLVDCPALPEPDPAYPHLQTLFCGLELDPASHAALHVFLLGCLHATSLDSERPILLVDSWVRARGKSEVSKAIAAILDGRPAEFSQSNRDSLHDEIVAHLGEGQRVFALDNIDGRRAYNNPLLCSLSTGTIGGRKKYSSKNSLFVGTVAILNTVYGAASFHHDLLSRCLRCELRGPARRLTVRPQFYAPANRLPILAECLAALSAARPYTAPTTTRFAGFELQAAAAYGHVFGLSDQEVHRRLEQAGIGARALLPSAVHSLHNKHGDAFDCPNDNVTGPGGGQKETIDGAVALGYELKNTVWSPLDNPTPNQ